MGAKFKLCFILMMKNLRIINNIRIVRIINNLDSIQIKSCLNVIVLWLKLHKIII